MINAIARLEGILLRTTCPLFFKKLGRGVMFRGRVRLPLPLRNISIGDSCDIGDAVYFHTGRAAQITIGDSCLFNTGCHLVANESITIGDNVSVGEYVSIRDQDHLFNVETGVVGQGYKVAPVVIGDNVWIGRGAYIGPGTRIERGTIIGANSVVRGIFPGNVLIAGAPAIVKKKLA